jgi:hypothetical protein
MFLWNVGTIYEAVRCHNPENRNMKYYKILFFLKKFFSHFSIIIQLVWFWNKPEW